MDNPEDKEPKKRRRRVKGAPYRKRVLIPGKVRKSKDPTVIKKTKNGKVIQIGTSFYIIKRNVTFLRAKHKKRS